MTAHPKRDYRTLNETDNQFEQFYQRNAEICYMTTWERPNVLSDKLDREWKVAESYGIPDEDIPEFILMRRRGRWKKENWNRTYL